jgi:hypothetical protein
MFLFLCACCICICIIEINELYWLEDKGQKNVLSCVTVLFAYLLVVLKLNFVCLFICCFNLHQYIGISGESFEWMSHIHFTFARLKALNLMLSLKFMKSEKAKAAGTIIVGNRVSLPKGGPDITVFIDREMREGVTKLCDLYILFFFSFFILLNFFSFLFYSPSLPPQRSPLRQTRSERKRSRLQYEWVNEWMIFTLLSNFLCFLFICRDRDINKRDDSWVVEWPSCLQKLCAISSDK